MEWTIPTQTDFSFLETVGAHGWRRLLPFTWDDATQTLERVERLASGRVVLLSIRAEGDRLTIRANEHVLRAEIERLVRHMMQLDLPMGDFHAFCARRPELCHIPARKQGRMLCSPTVWEDCCKVILTTNTTWTQTRAMTARLVNLYGSPLPSAPGRHAFPTPAQVAAVDTAEFAAGARLGYRAASVHQLATDIHGSALDLETLRAPHLEAGTLWKNLLALRGIGPYGAACLMLYLGRPEAVNADSVARSLLARELGRPVSDKDVHAFFADYGPWRGLVYNFFPWKPETDETPAVTTPPAAP